MTREEKIENKLTEGWTLRMPTKHLVITCKYVNYNVDRQGMKTIESRDIHF